MLKAKILDFLSSKANNISVLNCSSNFLYTDDLFEIISTGNYCDSDIDIGIIYLKKVGANNYLIIDGKRRILSLILIVKSILDYYTSKSDVELDKNTVFVQCSEFLSGINLRLFGLEKTVYDKIIKNEPISYNEKQTEICRTLNLFKENLYDLSLDIDVFFDLLLNLKAHFIFLDEKTDERDIFCETNKNYRKLNQLLLTKSYLAELNHAELVNDLYYLFDYKEDVFVSFFQAYLSPKFNRVISENNDVYSYFVKYMNMLQKYQDFSEIRNKITRTAKIYKKMYNADFMDVELRNMFIKLISSNGRDTFSYLLELCEDYDNKYLSKDTLLEVCNIIYTYVWERNRKTSSIGENIDFSKMVQELNKVIYEENSSSN